MIEITKNPRLARELARSYRNHNYEVDPNGVMLFHHSGLYVGGVMKEMVNGRDPMLLPNLVCLEGRRALLVGGLAGGQQYSSFYIAPFTGAVTPLEGWTAANFTSNATEFTSYTEATRQAWTKVLHATASSYNSDASPAVFTLAAGQTNVTFKGYGVLSQSAKSATTGILFAAVTANRTGLEAADVVSVTYTLAATDAS